MTNKEIWEIYRDYTAESTKYLRQLGFAAAAICWVFKSKTITFPTRITWSMAFLTLFFLSDVLQFFVSSLLIRNWNRREEKKMSEKNQSIEGDYKRPVWLDYPAFFLFNVKTLFLLISFIFIGIEFFSRT